MKIIRLHLTIFILMFFLAGSLLVAHDHNSESGILEGSGSARIFLKHGDTTLMTDYTGRIEGVDHEYQYQALTIGPYYRLHDNIKIGAFYRLQFGVLHEDDWIEDRDNPGDWTWRDTKKRDEHVGIGDITFRFLVPFIPGKNLVFEFKNRYLYNTFNNHHTLKTRPGLRYFIFYNKKPVLNIFAQYEMYFPLNYGVVTIYEQWLYGGFLAHFTDEFHAGLYGAYKKIVWGPSDEARDAGVGKDFKERYSAYIIGVVAMGRFKL